VRAALDNLDVAHGDGSAWGGGGAGEGKDTEQGDDGGEREGAGCQVAEDGLDASGGVGHFKKW